METIIIKEVIFQDTLESVQGVLLQSSPFRRSGETLSKGLLTLSSPTRISYRNRAQNQRHFHLQRFHIQLLLLVLHGLMT